MKRLTLIFAAVLGLWGGALWATVNAMNGVAITTASTIMGVTPVSEVMGQAVAAGSSYLIEENFNTGSGTTPPTGWTTSAGTWDYSNTSPALPQGGNNAKGGPSFGNGLAYGTFTSQTVAYGYFQFQTSGIPAASQNLVSMRDSGGSIVCRVLLLNTGALAIFNSSFESASTTDAISAATNVQVWFSYDSSGNTMTVGWSTDGTRPTSGNKYVSTGNTVNTAVERLGIEHTNDNTTISYYDHVLVNNTQIGSNP